MAMATPGTLRQHVWQRYKRIACRSLLDFTEVLGSANFSYGIVRQERSNAICLGRVPFSFVDLQCPQEHRCTKYGHDIGNFGGRFRRGQEEFARQIPVRLCRTVAELHLHCLGADWGDLFGDDDINDTIVTYCVYIYI